MFHASIADNIRYARPDAAPEAVVEATMSAGLGELVARLPDGANTIVGERGRALSAGERQRVAIARALLMNPAVLVLDEATAALDATAEAYVLDGYETLMRGRTTIIITHRPDVARRADRVLLLDSGRITDAPAAIPPAIRPADRPASSRGES